MGLGKVKENMYLQMEISMRVILKLIGSTESGGSLIKESNKYRENRKRK